MGSFVVFLFVGTCLHDRLMELVIMSFVPFLEAWFCIILLISTSMSNSCSVAYIIVLHSYVFC